MKKLLSITFALTLALGFISCKDDKEEVSPLIGTWAKEKETISECDDTSDNSVENFECNETTCEKVIFEAGGDMYYETTVNKTTVKLPYTYKENGNNTIDICSSVGCITYTYNFDGGKLNRIEKDPKLRLQNNHYL